jgi:hypothetical protein
MPDVRLTFLERSEDLLPTEEETIRFKDGALRQLDKQWLSK